MRDRMLFGLVCAALLASQPAVAEVAAANDSGFVSHHTVEVAAAPAEAWTEMLRPAGWWNPEHSYSGDAANLSLVPTAGGCFCEAIPEGGGAVEHMRVLYIDPRVHRLRLGGALGPLQAEALTGVLTMTIEPAGAGSRITWDYVVGGYMRGAIADFAPAVDAVVGEQLQRLAANLRGG